MAIIIKEVSEVEVCGVLQGKVFGSFETDTARRDLIIVMLWGTPVALTFGIIGAIVTTTTTILQAVVSS